jgi:hypothetical protein
MKESFMIVESLQIIISLVIGVVVLFGICIITYEITKSRELTWIVGVILCLTAIYISFKKINGISVKESIADVVAYIKSTTGDISSLVDDRDSKFYAISEKEIDKGIIDDGLWSQALVKAKGDENLRKIEYMKLRVKQLKKGK